MKLSNMARRIEELRPGTLPKSLTVFGQLLLVTIKQKPACDHLSVTLDDDLAHAILRDAMGKTLGCVERDWYYDPRWSVMVNHGRKHFRDADHGGCPTRSLFAAFCAAFQEYKP